MTLNEILDELEKPTGLSSDKNADSNEDDSNGLVKKSEGKVHNLHIMPPNDGAVTDEDSGEEDHVDISNLPAT